MERRGSGPAVFLSGALAPRLRGASPVPAAEHRLRPA